MTVGAEWWYGINDGSEAADPLVLLGAREPVILHYIVNYLIFLKKRKRF